jgi:hypothetical protein
MVTQVRIIRTPKNAMQSGKKHMERWQLEFPAARDRFLDPLMGWTGASDMRQELALRFDTAEEAASYATRQGYAYEILAYPAPKQRAKAYAENFAFQRIRAFSVKRAG